MVMQKSTDKVCTREEAAKSVWRADLGLGGAGGIRNKNGRGWGTGTIYKSLKKAWCTGLLLCGELEGNSEC